MNWSFDSKRGGLIADGKTRQGEEYPDWAHAMALWEESKASRSFWEVIGAEKWPGCDRLLNELIGAYRECVGRVRLAGIDYRKNNESNWKKRVEELGYDPF